MNLNKLNTIVDHGNQLSLKEKALLSKTSLSSRERVCLALSHREPDRIPFSWSFGPQPPVRRALDEYLKPYGLDFSQLYAETSDVRRFDARYVGPVHPRGGDRGYWGWTVRDVSYGQGSYEEFDYQPLASAESLADIESHAWPDPDLFAYGDLMGQVHAADPEHRYFRILWGGNPLEILSWLMGLEKMMMTLAEEPALIQAALERITGILETILRRSVEAAPEQFDAIYFADDLGGQHGPLISRATYRQCIMPYHRRLCALAHNHARFTIHHSDGSVFALLGDLIEAGVDCLEAVQVECRDMEPEQLKRSFGDRLAFQGAVSVQQVLPHLNAGQVRQEVRRIKEILGSDGGYICAPSHAIQAGTPPENVIAMVEEALEIPLAEIARNAHKDRIPRYGLFSAASLNPCKS